MPLPVDCSISEDTCCVDMYSVAEHILVNVKAAILGCYAEIPCGVSELKSYVTMGRGDDGVRDALTAAVTGVAASPGSTRQGVQVPVTLQRVTIEIRLREQGWPMAQLSDDGIIVPDPDLQNALARHAYAHGEMMYRKLLHMQSTGTLKPTALTGCVGTAVGILNPIAPLGGVVGWFVPVTMDMHWGGG